MHIEKNFPFYWEMFPIHTGKHFPLPLDSFPLSSGKLFSSLLGTVSYSYWELFFISINFPTVKQKDVFGHEYLLGFSNQDITREYFKGETLPERFKRGKLFPDDYPRILKNIHPCPKWPTGSGKVSTPRFLGAPINFCYISFLI